MGVSIHLIYTGLNAYSACFIINRTSKNYFGRALYRAFPECLRVYSGNQRGGVALESELPPPDFNMCEFTGLGVAASTRRWLVLYAIMGCI